MMSLDKLKSELNISFLVTDNIISQILLLNLVMKTNNGTMGSISFRVIMRQLKTVLSHDENTIIKAKIYFNSGFSMSTESSNANFIGNIFSHELGHALGLLIQML